MDFDTILIIVGSVIGGLILLSIPIGIACCIRHGCRLPEYYSYEKAFDKAKEAKKKPSTTLVNTDLQCQYCPVPPESPSASINISPPDDPDAIVPVAPNAPYNPTYASPSGLNELTFVVSTLSENISTLQEEVEELRFSRDLFIKKIAKIEKSLKSNNLQS